MINVIPNTMPIRPQILACNVWLVVRFVQMVKLA